MNILIKSKKKLFLVCFCLLSISFAQAQQNVRGVVKDVQGEQIPGATIRKADLSGSVASVGGEKLSAVRATSISQAMQGAMPGVQATRTNSPA